MNQNPRTDPATPRRAVIFGGAGFIGRHICLWLSEQAEFDEIVLADIAAPSWQLPPNARFEHCDVRRPIPDSFAPCDLIVNLAAVHRTPGHPDHEYHETNESGATNVVDFATAAQVQRIWFTSSIAVYGPGEEAKTEQSEPTPVSAYGKSKLAAEAIHDAWARGGAGRSLVIARPATVFGPGEGGNFTRLAKALRRRSFFYPGRRDTLKACGYVAELAPSFAFMERLADPVALYNFAMPSPPTIEQVCRAMSQQAGLPLPRVTVPSAVLLRGGALLHALGVEAVNPERIRKLMHSTNVRGDALVDAGYQWRTDIDSAIADWYHQPPAGELV